MSPAPTILLGVTMRFYAPKTPAFYGRWAPALVKLTEGKIQAIPQ
jgi:hypothetical protein